MEPTDRATPSPSRPRIPTHIVWPAFVIGLLLTSVVMMMVVLYLASADGGAQVIDNYYQKAVDWDVQRAEEARSDALGWSAALTVAPGSAGSLVTCVITDAAGDPVTGLDVRLTAFRPQFANPQAAARLPGGEAPGTYVAEVPLYGRGLWDLHVRAVNDSAVFVETIRQNL